MNNSGLAAAWIAYVMVILLYFLAPTRHEIDRLQARVSFLESKLCVRRTVGCETLGHDQVIH